jgi:hypothetical protein
VTTIAGAVFDPRISEEAALGAETGSGLLAGLDGVVVMVERGTRLVTAVAAMLVNLGVVVLVLLDFDIVIRGGSLLALGLGLVFGLRGTAREVDNEAVALLHTQLGLGLLGFIISLPVDLLGAVEHVSKE